MRRHHRGGGWRTVGVGTPNDIVTGAGTPDQVIIGMDEFGRPVVGSFWGSVTHALNPINQVKMLYNVAKNPLDPFAQTRAIRNLFSSGGGGGAPAAPQWGQAPQAPQYMPPGQYAPQQPWAQPQAPQYAPQQYSPPGSYYPADPNAGYGYAPPQDFGPQPTGWDASYGGGY